MKRFLITMQHDESFFLPIFLSHYKKYFPSEHIYIIDHGSSVNLIPADVNRIFIPRDSGYSEADRLKIIKNFSSILLDKYDYGVYSDADELINLDFFLESSLIENTCIRVLGFETSNYGGRIIGTINPQECKPLIFSEIPDWGPGFHYDHNPIIQQHVSVPMAHIRYLFNAYIQTRAQKHKREYEKFNLHEKKIGYGIHWQSTLDHYQEFIKWNLEEDIKNKNLISIKSASIESKYLFTQTNNKSWLPIGNYKILALRYDLSEIFNQLKRYLLVTI